MSLLAGFIRQLVAVSAAEINRTRRHVELADPSLTGDAIHNQGTGEVMARLNMFEFIQSFAEMGVRVMVFVDPDEAMEWLKKVDQE